ncbi:MAG TPA: AarF/UbiB family protein [Thermoanaerobaculia bacterium]|nr:AarF/UbiB family protein [Thermoanaerobaculia bacterium]
MNATATARRPTWVLAANLRRLAWIVRVLAAHGLAMLIGARLARWPWLARRLPPGELPRPERARRVIEDVGGTFIKLGQMLALQPDIVPLEYCRALSNLLDRVPPFGMDAVERTFVEEIGRPTGEIFDSFDPLPLATASVGQVHVAWLDGRKLAVKVQRPNVKTDFAGDILLMTSMVRLIRALRLRALEWMTEPLLEFIAWTAEELDYRTEARYMEQLRINCRDNPAERVPEIFWTFTTPRTLVLEFFEGLTLLGYLRAREQGDDVAVHRLALGGFEPQQFARNIIDNFLGDAFLHGMFHADLHPANLMILPGNVVGYVDFGITGILSPYSREHLIRLTLAYTQGDLDAMCEAFFKVSVLDAGSDPEGFRDGLKRMADSWYDLRGRERQLRKNFTLVMLDMLHLSRATGIWPERDVIKYIRSAIAIDGLITRFAPGFDVGRYLATVCDRHLRQEVWRLLFSYERMVEWSAAAGNLAQDGGARAASFLERATDRRPGPLGGGRPPAAAAPEVRAFRLGTVVFSIALLVTVTGERAVLGANLFTAEILVGGAALSLFLHTLRRCV